MSCITPPSDRLGAISVAVRVDPLVEDQGVATLTYYDASTLPRISEVRPNVADDSKPQALHVLGHNFAPLSAKMMRCSFGADGFTAATFISPTELACTSPVSSLGESHTADLRVSLDGHLFSAPGESAFHLVNAAAAPHLSQIVPPLGPAAGGSVLTLTGRGFAPARGRLQCTFGDGMLRATAATFDTSEKVRCVTLAASGADRADDGALASAWLGTAGGSPPASSPLNFVYHDPTRPPGVSSVSPAYGDVHSPPSVLSGAASLQSARPSMRVDPRRLLGLIILVIFLIGHRVDARIVPHHHLHPLRRAAARRAPSGRRTCHCRHRRRRRAGLWRGQGAERLSYLPLVRRVRAARRDVGLAGTGPPRGTVVTVSGHNLAPTPELAASSMSSA